MTRIERPEALSVSVAGIPFDQDVIAKFLRAHEHVRLYAIQCEQDVAKWDAEIGRLRSALASVEYVYPGPSGRLCPVCFRYPEEGHAETCRLSAALRTSEPDVEQKRRLT